MKQCFAKCLQKFNQKPLAMIVWFISFLCFSSILSVLLISWFVLLQAYSFAEVFHLNLIAGLNNNTNKRKELNVQTICIFWTEICVVFKLKYIFFTILAFVFRLLKSSQDKAKRNKTINGMEWNEFSWVALVSVRTFRRLFPYLKMHRSNENEFLFFHSAW